MTILILGGDDDQHASFLLGQLRADRHDAELLDSRWFPAELGLAHDPAAGEWTIRLPSGRSLGHGEVTAVYWRCYNSVSAPPLPDEEQAFIAANDARGLFESFLIGYPARWVNGWAGFLLHQTKPVQLAAVAALGVPVPATLLSNDAGAVRAFVARHPRAIFKPVQGGAHARRVTPQHTSDGNLSNLRFAPVTLQEEVPGTDVRVFVAGERVLACEVRSEALDYRDEDEPEIVAHTLPAPMQECCRRIARRLDLLWAGLDFRLTPGGRYVFLEANPSPMFLGFEARSGLPLTNALVELLTAR
jgi:glutathione synthase/RimK-type ligase-like ATP-grasp enzyme